MSNQQRSRMTYGSQPETAARQELFAAPGPRAAPPSAAYGGRYPTREDLQYMDNRQILDSAVEQHKDTTATARRALQVVEQTKELQATTMTSLQDQRQQMQRIGTGMDKIGTDLTYSQRILRYMSMCCCVGFFCSSCTEPDRTDDDRQWRNGPPPGYNPPRGGAPAPRAAAAAPAARGGKGGRDQQPPAAPQYPPVSTDGLSAAGYGEHAAVIKEETRQQDAYLYQISQGLEQLKQGALVMQEEIGRQDQNVNRLQGDAHLLHSKLNSVNREGFRNI